MTKTAIEVNTATLKSDVSTIEGELRALRSGATKLRNTAEQLGRMWDGAAKEAFMAAVRDDLNRLENLIKALETFTDQTAEIRQEYDNCETTVEQIIASIRV